MNATDYTFLLNKPEAINERYAESLEKVIEQFPYFQSSRVMRLKHLYNQDSYKYNQELKTTAAYTCDRSILFDFITSNDFKAVQKGLYEKKLVYTIPDDLTDREYRVSMQYGNFGEFRNLSPDFLEVLKIMAMEITGDKPGNVKLALKYAKEVLAMYMVHQL